MANPNPLMAESSGTYPADAAVQSALRTLDAGAAASLRYRRRCNPISARPLSPPPT